MRTTQAREQAQTGQGSRFQALLASSYTLLALVIALVGLVATAASTISRTQDSIAQLQSTAARHEDEIRTLRDGQDQIIKLLYGIKGALDERKH